MEEKIDNLRRKKVNLEATVADLTSSVNWLALKANSSVEEVLSHT